MSKSILALPTKVLNECAKCQHERGVLNPMMSLLITEKCECEVSTSYEVGSYDVHPEWLAISGEVAKAEKILGQAKSKLMDFESRLNNTNAKQKDVRKSGVTCGFRIGGPRGFDPSSPDSEASILPINYGSGMVYDDEFDTRVVSSGSSVKTVQDPGEGSTCEPVETYTGEADYSEDKS